MKQSKLRRRRVIRFAIVYFVLLVVFVALVAGPVFAGKAGITATLKKAIGTPGGMQLFQDPKVKQNNTAYTQTGTGAGDGPPGGGAASTGDSSDFRKIKLF